MTVQVPPLQNQNQPQQVLLLTQLIIEMLKGRDNSVGTFTLTANVASTTVTDNLFSSDMMPVWTPTTANASAEVGAGTIYVSARTNGSFTVTHANNAQADRIFLYSRRG